MACYDPKRINIKYDLYLIRQAPNFRSRQLKTANSVRLLDIKTEVRTYSVAGLAHLALQNVNKDYAIFLYFHKFIAKSDQKPKMENGMNETLTK